MENIILIEWLIFFIQNSIDINIFCRYIDPNIKISKLKPVMQMDGCRLHLKFKNLFAAKSKSIFWLFCTHFLWIMHCEESNYLIFGRDLILDGIFLLRTCILCDRNIKRKSFFLNLRWAASIQSDSTKSKMQSSLSPTAWTRQYNCYCGTRWKPSDDFLCVWVKTILRD